MSLADNADGTPGGRRARAGRVAGDRRPRRRGFHPASTDSALPPDQSKIPPHILAALDARARGIPWPTIAEFSGVTVGSARHWTSLYPQAWAATRQRLINAADDHFKPLIPYADRALSAALVSGDERTGLAAASLTYAYAFGKPRTIGEQSSPAPIYVSYIDARVLQLIEAGAEIPEKAKDHLTIIEHH